jgi:GAF domain-containing protein
VIDDLLSDQRFLHQVAAEARYVPSAMMAARIESGGEVLGVVEVLDPDLAGSHSRRIRQLGELATELASALGGGLDG